MAPNNTAADMAPDTWGSTVGEAAAEVKKKAISKKSAAKAAKVVAPDEADASRRKCWCEDEAGPWNELTPAHVARLKTQRSQTQTGMLVHMRRLGFKSCKTVNSNTLSLFLNHKLNIVRHRVRWAAFAPALRAWIADQAHEGDRCFAPAAPLPAPPPGSDRKKSTRKRKKKKTSRARAALQPDDASVGPTYIYPDTSMTGTRRSGRIRKPTRKSIYSDESLLHSKRRKTSSSSSSDTASEGSTTSSSASERDSVKADIDSWTSPFDSPLLAPDHDSLGVGGSPALHGMDAAFKLRKSSMLKFEEQQQQQQQYQQYQQYQQQQQQQQYHHQPQHPASPLRDPAQLHEHRLPTSPLRGVAGLWFGGTTLDDAGAAAMSESVRRMLATDIPIQDVFANDNRQLRYT